MASAPPLNLPAGPCSTSMPLCPAIWNSVWPNPIVSTRPSRVLPTGKTRALRRTLRAVFSIHPETVDLIAAVDANINSLADLKGKRVNIGNIGSGYRKNAIDALEANGLDFNKDFHAESLRAAEAPGLIQDGRIDAAFYTVGHPSGYYKEATSGVRKVKFVPIENVDGLLAKYPYYAKAVTRVVELYPGAKNDANVPTFGVKATFVTSAKVPDNVVYAIVKEVFDNFEDL